MMLRFITAICLCIFATDVFAGSQCRIDWVKKICEETDAPFVEVLNKIDFENISDNQIDAINIKFGKISSVFERENTSKLVNLASKLLRISQSELWRCLYYFERTEERLSLMKAGMLCSNTILSK